jgi:hypothetical protein
MNIDGVYNELVATGVPIGNNESDLHVPMNSLTIPIVAEYENFGTVTKFHNKLDGKMWFDIPFAYTPWWTERGM